MALCDFLISTDIVGYNCASPMVKGAEQDGLLINWADVDFSETTINYDTAEVTIALKCGGKKAYKITQSGKQPWNGSQQEMVEGAFQNTLTNTVQFAILKQDELTAEDIYALANGQFVAILQNKNGTVQIYGIETGLHATEITRAFYDDDTLSGWRVTMQEENATMSLFIESYAFSALQVATNACS